ncbi:Adenosylhomocysteinase (EC 3.3.1.1) [Caballeronia glathei]|jgi:hypothetical protein|uniref:Flagellar protein FliT n=1 Tax=Caballeronia glathei TaxID=60547 RepID=A0A069PJI1_9BURK|nr:hypothetical protein [Caballeronia glathei]KDR40084.1 flagellar protein FliT [Caballeronia glathei]CEJ96459.1 Adenosylhomocysteinase (EC 3.3.1.1) [Caballeronia glathei]
MNQQDAIQQAWSLTEAIEAAAAAGDWPRAAHLAEARSPYLMSLEADQDAYALATIRRIQSSTASMMQAAQTAQAALVANHRRSMDQANAAGLYQQAARL